MARRFSAIVLALSLVLPVAVMSQQKTAQSSATSTPLSPVASSSPQSAQESRTVRRQQVARQRSFERETNIRRRPRGITKKEWVFLGAVAGTSMGIGALAGGAKGMAIGGIVGGWGAYLGHCLWDRIR